MDLKGKVAVVTGSGGPGCGGNIARRLAHAGVMVVVTDIEDAGGLETVRCIQSENGIAVFCHADVGVEEDVRALFKFAELTFGGVDIVVNNAGPYFPDDPLQMWAETIQANLLGTIYCTLHGLESLRRRGGGAIVTIGSTSAIGHGRKHSPSPAYDVAKVAVMRIATTLAYLRETDNIRVNCLIPDWVATAEVQAYVNSLTAEERKARDVPEELIPLEEIGDLVLRLATDERLGGRVVIRWCGQRAQLIPLGDRGYGSLEPF